MLNLDSFYKATSAVCIAVIISCGNVEAPDDHESGGGTDSTSAPDTIPPGNITDAVLTFNDSSFIITLAWTAPHDDSLTEKVHHYLIRYSTSFYAINSWNLGIPVFDAPGPSLPGIMQSYTGFVYYLRGRQLYAALKSVDESGNISDVSNIASVHIPGYRLAGKCADVLDGRPAAGMDVALSAGNTTYLQTDADGLFEKDDLLSGPVYLTISNGTGPAIYHDYFEKKDFTGDTLYTIPMIPFLPSNSPGFKSILHVLKNLMSTASGGYNSTQIHKWNKFPVKCYIPAFINSSMIDFQAQAYAAANRWMAATGHDIFEFVSSPPDTGIEMSYRTQEEMGVQKGITYFSFGDDDLPLKHTIAIADYLPDSVFVYRIMLHEMGHTVGLGHSYDPNFIMYISQPLPGDISAEEITVMQLLFAIPNYTFMDSYDESAP